MPSGSGEMQRQRCAAIRVHGQDRFEAGGGAVAVNLAQPVARRDGEGNQLAHRGAPMPGGSRGGLATRQSRPCGGDDSLARVGAGSVGRADPGGHVGERHWATGRRDLPAFASQRGPERDGGRRAWVVPLDAGDVQGEHDAAATEELDAGPAHLEGEIDRGTTWEGKAEGGLPDLPRVEPESGGFEQHNIQHSQSPIATRSATVRFWAQDQYEADLAAWEAKARHHLMQGCESFASSARLDAP